MTSTPPHARLPTTASPRSDRDGIAPVLARHAENPSAFLALNAGTEHFMVAGVDGVIAYRFAGRSTIAQIGRVFAPPPAPPARRRLPRPARPAVTARRLSGLRPHREAPGRRRPTDAW